MIAVLVLTRLGAPSSIRLIVPLLVNVPLLPICTVCNPPSSPVPSTIPPTLLLIIAPVATFKRIAPSCLADIVPKLLIVGFVHDAVHLIAFLFAVITCSFLHIKWLNMGLSRFSTLYIYPLNKSIWIISSILGGIIVFQESKDFEDKPVKAIFFVFGILIMCFGIFKISREQISQEVDAIELEEFV